MLKEIVKARLDELGRNAFEAARIGGLERSYVNDILNGKKKSIKADMAARLAKALDLPDASILVDSTAAALWESLTESALDAAFSEGALNEISLSDPRTARYILEAIRDIAATYSKFSKGIANPQAIRELVYYDVLRALGRRRRETAEEKLLSRRSSPSNSDERKPPKG